MSELEKLYHERQKRQFCLLHALNNLFQCEEFKKEELDGICEEFDDRVWFNPHRSFMGLGNYDVNILLKCLETRGLEGVWFDRRKSAVDINCDNVIGFVFNIPSDSFLNLIVRGRHWFSVKKIGNFFYNLDSKQPEPTVINDFILFTNSVLSKDTQNQLFLVVKPENRDNVFI
ncbi:unnamed protein product [Bursaphelenchus okinawaensis]|uniref:ubiquitinyl hydrolase 1 n=1 Tax=Bursaphelenchus okinawaensis TaxID=465554 RepID=A0A811KK30_9BILA|nr:unnamed protein product [Bursaphelenchus okinawaensis]CAG9104598.1 unnamed protein product [Bursaphelenchus okinawaensis]